MAMHSRNLVRVRKLHTALVGGRLALATFQLKPPFGRSMVEEGGLGRAGTPPRVEVTTGQFEAQGARARRGRDPSPCGRLGRDGLVVSEATGGDTISGRR